MIELIAVTILILVVIPALIYGIAFVLNILFNNRNQQK
ncbi:hypothetical protein BXY53_0473 [Dichotomicrobium thermohalophilum]|jgi:hypothetical protein|uniref:Uncharacterized protein n=1 Tax=Dichotomicrobium thermohalophilum TaxID=933063 RepID=A0A397Q2Y0_9HYPH|nr:hypothetical protein BXY53_0473 [Dichotomicrobium thermohalophilum]